MTVDFKEQMQSPDYGTRKLAHYNNWLLNEKRVAGAPYPGFPEDMQLARGRERLQAEYAAKAEKKAATVAKTKTTKQEKPAKAKKARDSSEGPTKQQRANDIFSECKGDKQQTISTIQQRLGMTLAGATTYFYNAKKFAC